MSRKTRRWTETATDTASAAFKKVKRLTGNLPEACTHAH